VIPTAWPEAGLPPNSNIIGTDPQLSDPEKLDFTLKSGSPAVGYGCQTFASSPPAARWPRNDAASCPRAAGDAGLLDADGADRTVAARVAIPARCARSLIEASGDVTVDTLWDADTVLVTGDVTVVHPATLTVAGGTNVVFEDHYALTVAGRLLAIGTASDPILFTTDEPEAFAPDSTTTGSWAGIRFPWTPAATGESRLEWCTLEYAKSVDGDGLGGAITSMGYSNLLVRNCIFRSNIAVYGGAVACTHQAAPTFVNCLFDGNRTFWHGSAIYSEYGYPKIISCTFADNQVTNGNEYERTGVVHSHIGKPSMTGSVVWGNVSPYYLPGELTECKSFYTTYSCIEEGGGGTGSFDADPLYTGFGPAAFSPVPWSPCINAGPADTTALRLLAIDLVDGARILEGRLDMGCYEPLPITLVDPAESVLALSPPFPNPMRGRCELAFSVATGGAFSMDIYDIAGRHVRTIGTGTASPGLHSAAWDGTNDSGESVSAGVYFVRLSLDGFDDAARKIVLIR